MLEVQSNMTPQQAVQVVERLTAGVTGTRNDHLQLMAALTVLKKLIPAPTPVPVPAEKAGAESKAE